MPRGVPASIDIRKPSGTNLPEASTRASTSRRVPAKDSKYEHQGSVKQPPVMEVVEESSSSEDWDDMVMVNPGGKST